MLNSHQTHYRCIAKTLKGMEDVLYTELEELGYSNLRKRNRAVEFVSDINGIYRANLELRTALSVLVNIIQFDFKIDKDIYRKAYDIEWEEIFDEKKTFMIVNTVYGDVFNTTYYPALVLKDAIVDRFRAKTKKRPSIDKERPDIVIDLYISHNTCTISINSSGEPLYKRGYRGMSFEAPLNECLAAGMVLLSGWNKKENLINPMCGSGTILVEAALMAYNIQPSALREDFSFMNWKFFDKEEFNKLRRAPEDMDDSNFKKTLEGSDLSRRALSTTSFSLERFGLADKVNLNRMDFNKAKRNTEEGVVILNPPYGERLELPDIEKAYEAIGDSLKTNYQNHRAWVLSSNMEAMKFIGLKAKQKIDLMNGKLPCKYTGFELYSGSRREVD